MIVNDKTGRMRRENTQDWFEVISNLWDHWESETHKKILRTSADDDLRNETREV
jgi:hypothetical protein